MSKFKVGDRVIRLTDNMKPDEWGVKGFCYTVLDIDGVCIDITGDGAHADSNEFELAKINVGDVVSLRPDMDYAYGRGEVPNGEMGVVTNLVDYDTLVINFPQCTQWWGKNDEVMFVSRGVEHVSTPKKKPFKLRLDYFPQCCTARVIHSFGGTGTAIFVKDVSQEEIEEALKAEIDHCMDKGLAMVTCTTNNQQEAANKALLKVGFSHSKWMSKEVHPETRVRLWWYPLEG